MAITYRKVRLVMGLVDQNSSDKSLIVPSSASVYKSDKTTLATLYADETGTALSNPVPTNVADGAPGLDAVGNLVIYVDIGQYFYVLLNGHYEPIPEVGINGHDFTDHLDGTVSDPHGDRADAATKYTPLSQAGIANGYATLDGNAQIPAAQIVID